MLGLGLHDEAEVVDQLVLGQGLQLPLSVVLGHRLVDAVLGGLGADPALLKDVLAKDWRSRIRVGGIAQRYRSRFSPSSPEFDSRRSQEVFQIILDAAEIDQQHFLECRRGWKCWSNHQVLVCGKLVLQKKNEVGYDQARIRHHFEPSEGRI